MKRFGSVVAGTALIGLMVTSAWAIPSTKFTARYSKMVIMTDNETDDTSKIHMATVKVPNKKELLIGVSIQTSIETETTVKGKKGSGGSATASGKIAVMVTLEDELSGGFSAFTLAITPRRGKRQLLAQDPPRSGDYRIGPVSSVAERFIAAVRRDARVAPAFSDGARAQRMMETVSAIGE